ncbi:MAG: segregation and condensation protein A [Lachnospiraceae bacterium]
MEKKELTVKLPVFEGPLDLLLHLLEKNKVSVYDIPIVEITNQYLEYMEEMKRQDLDIMSEFLVMAATLIDIKSRMLLPRQKKEEDGESEDPRAELVQQLLEYKMYKCMSYELKDRQVDAQKVMFHKPDIPPEVKSYEEPVDLNELLSGLTITKLNEIFKSVIRRQENKIDPIRSKFGRIEKEEVSLTDKMREVEDYARAHQKFSFRNLLQEQHSKIQVIVTFLAILEMMKTGKIYISQESIYEDISIESKIADVESA